MGDVHALAGRVDDQMEPVAGPRHHQVVDDAAVVVGELGVAHGPGREARDIPRHEAFESSGAAAAGEAQLAHVRDIEEPGGGACLRVLRDDARAVAHRHGIAGEADKTGAERAVLVEEWGPGEVGTGVFAHGISQARGQGSTTPCGIVRRPLCLGT